MIKYYYYLIILNVVIFSCSTKRLHQYSNSRNQIEKYGHLNDSTLILTGISQDKEFGLNEKKPIMLGLADVHKAALNVEKYLNALSGPNDEKLKFERLKPCCPFKTKNFTYTVPQFGLTLDYKHGMLERYYVQYGDSGNEKKYILFFNLYDETTKLVAPKGFNYKSN